MTSGEKIKAKRQAMHLSLEELSRRSGLSFERIEELESGASLPVAEEYSLLSKVLNCQIEDLMESKSTYEGSLKDSSPSGIVDTKKRTLSPTRAIAHIVIYVILGLIALVFFLAFLIILAFDEFEWNTFIITMISLGVFILSVEEVVRSIRYLIHYRREKRRED